MSATNTSPRVAPPHEGSATNQPVPVERRGDTLLAAGGILAAIAAASCCVVPFALFVLGINGAWIGNLTALEPYQPIFATLAAGAIGYGFYLVYWKPTAICEDGSYCASPRSTRVTKAALWLATVIVVVAIGFPRLAPMFL